MTTFSRKKIRGYGRKLRQLEDWKNYIISYPTEYLSETSFQIFRIHLSPFNWYRGRNPHLKFHKHLYQACHEILQNLKDNDFIKNNNLRVQLWLFYPRTIKSLVIITDKENYLKRNERIKAFDTEKGPPNLFNKYFDTFRIKLADDNVFNPIATNNKNTEWQTLKVGEIWTIE
jgi:hypothetical protein